MIADAVYLSHIKNKKRKYQRCSRLCPLCRFSWKATKKCCRLPSSVLGLFDRRALISKADGSVIASVSMALFMVCQEFQLRDSYSNCRDASILAESLVKNCFNGYSGITSRFLSDCASMAFLLLEIGVTCQQCLDWLTKQLSTWNHCFPLFKGLKRVPSAAIKDEIYTCILGVLLGENTRLSNGITGSVPGPSHGERRFYRKRILSRYSLVSLESGSQFLTSLLYSNPLPSAVIVDSESGRIVLSSTMAQEILWTVPLPFSCCNRKLFERMGNLLQYYFCVLSKTDIVESFDKLSSAVQWERASGRQRISCGLREEVFGQAGHACSEKLTKMEKLYSLCGKSDHENWGSFPCLEFGHPSVDKCERPEQHSYLDRRIRSCGYNALLMCQTLLYRKWSLAVRLLQCARNYSVPARRLAVKRRMAVSQKFAWKLGLHLLFMQRDNAKFNNKVRAFLSHALRKHWAIRKMDAFVDVYLLLNMKSGEHEASRFAVIASAHASDLIDEDRRSMALISAYETLFTYRNANSSELNIEDIASQSMVMEAFPSAVSMRESMRSHLSLLRSGQLFLETLVDMHDSTTGLVDLFKEYSISWTCNLVILSTAVERFREKEKRYFLKKLEKIKKRYLFMQ